MDPGKVVYYERPALRNPDLVAAFLGWPDAAQVATGAASYLVNQLQARKFAEMKSDDYYDFSTVRPTVTIENGYIQPVRLPENGFYYWLNKTGVRDIIIVTGIEPQLKWHSYVDVIVDVAIQYNVNRVYAIGGLFDRIPHTRETRMSGLVSDPTLINTLVEACLDPISYSGPSSIHGLLLNECTVRNVPAISVWGHVPFYIRADSNPIVCLQMVKKIAELCEFQIDTDELSNASIYLRDVLSKLIAESEQMRNFLTTLEEQYDLEGSSPNTEVAGAGQIIQDIENFLKKQRGKG
jgi:proteasome assembly chaperone (PAC2) family protein